jgi:multiple antibiotic resistance protein
LQFSIINLFLFLMVVGGATKAAGYFAAAGAALSRAERSRIVLRAVTIQAVILSVFAAFGARILAFFHVSVGAIEIAGGIILFVFALGLVLGDEHDQSADQPVGDMSIYPLAVPLLASPQAIVAIVVIFSRAPDQIARVNAWVALGLLLLVNLGLLFGMSRLMGDGETALAKKGSGFAGVLLRVIAIMLCALAVELVVLGLREYGILPPAMAGAGSGH